MEMGIRSITKVALKLTGIYLMSVAFVGLAQLLYLPAEPVGWYLVYLGAYLVVGFSLYWLPGTIADHILHFDASSADNSPAPSRLLGVAVVLMGIYFVASAIFSIAYTLALAKWFYSATATFGGERGPGLSPEQFASVVSSATKLAVGIALWLGWRQTVRFSGGGEHDR